MTAASASASEAANPFFDGPLVCTLLLNILWLVLTSPFHTKASVVFIPTFHPHNPALSGPLNLATTFIC